VKYIFPVVVSVAGAFNLPAWAVNIITRVVPSLIGIVEEASPAPGTGPVKKQMVLDATEKLVVLMGSTFTGGAAVTFDKIKPVLSVLIDQTVSATNAIAPKVIANDVVVSGPNMPVDTP
jgi:hypothetical protein